MSAWDDSHWTGYDASILNVFAGGETAWIDFSYNRLGRVGWRRILGDTAEDVSRVLAVAIAARETGKSVLVRATNGSGPGGTAEITALQTI
jgi:hypothetical protein